MRKSVFLRLSGHSSRTRFLNQKIRFAVNWNQSGNIKPVGTDVPTNEKNGLLHLRLIIRI